MKKKRNFKIAEKERGTIVLDPTTLSMTFKSGKDGKPTIKESDAIERIVVSLAKLGTDKKATDEGIDLLTNLHKHVGGINGSSIHRVRVESLSYNEDIDSDLTTKLSFTLKNGDPAIPSAPNEVEIKVRRNRVGGAITEHGHNLSVRGGVTHLMTGTNCAPFHLASDTESSTASLLKSAAFILFAITESLVAVNDSDFKFDPDIWRRLDEGDCSIVNLQLAYYIYLPVTHHHRVFNYKRHLFNLSTLDGQDDIRVKDTCNLNPDHKIVDTKYLSLERGAPPERLATSAMLMHGRYPKGRGKFDVHFSEDMYTKPASELSKAEKYNLSEDYVRGFLEEYGLYDLLRVDCTFQKVGLHHTVSAASQILKSKKEDLNQKITGTKGGSSAPSLSDVLTAIEVFENEMPGGIIDWLEICIDRYTKFPTLNKFVLDSLNGETASLVDSKLLAVKKNIKDSSRKTTKKARLSALKAYSTPPPKGEPFDFVRAVKASAENQVEKVRNHLPSFLRMELAKIGLPDSIPPETLKFIMNRSAFFGMDEASYNLLEQTERNLKEENALLRKMIKSESRFGKTILDKQVQKIEKLTAEIEEIEKISRQNMSSIRDLLMGKYGYGKKITQKTNLIYFKQPEPPKKIRAKRKDDNYQQLMRLKRKRQKELGAKRTSKLKLSK